MHFDQVHFSPNVRIQIPQKDLYTSSWGISCEENLVEDQSIFPFVVILKILITFFLDMLISLGEN